jgi:hypothetical protein
MSMMSEQTMSMVMSEQTLSMVMSKATRSTRHSLQRVAGTLKMMGFASVEIENASGPTPPGDEKWQHRPQRRKPGPNM